MAISKEVIELNDSVIDGSKVEITFYDSGVNVNTHDCKKHVCNRYEANEEGLEKLANFRIALDRIEKHLIERKKILDEMHSTVET